jgi:hypothetical protein
MHAPDGRAVQIPYSKVHDQIKNGYLFADKNTLQQYARDVAADPMSEDRIDQFLDKHPWIAAPVRFAVENPLKGLGTGLLRTWTGADRLPTSRLETEEQIAAATPVQGPQQAGGELAEGLGEFFSGDELFSMLGKASQGLGIADRLKAATGLAQTLEKYPALAKLAKIGSTAVKQGTIAGAQTYAKTGSPAAALATGAETAGGAGLAEGAGAAAGKLAEKLPQPAEAPAPGTKTVGGVKIPVPAEAGAAATPTAAASAQAYGNLSREAIAESLKKIATPQQVDAALNATHDLTGAVDRQRELLKPAYDELNQVTNGRFRELNGEVNAAQKLARTGKPEDIAAYQNKLKEMQELLSNTSGWPKGLITEYIDNVKAAWRQNYILEDFGERWDRNLNGAPGASKVSNEQRGINGNGLMRDIQTAIRIYGRDHVAQGLGPGRLEAFEEIARLNQTNAQRKAFNMAVNEVAKNLPKPQGVGPLGQRALAMVSGAAIAHMSGASPYMGALGGEATYETTRAVLNAVKTNPAIAKNLLFAIRSGAKAENYGPWIAQMIEKSRETGDEETPKQGNKGDQE